MAHEERSDGYFSFLDPEGNVFFQTALRVSLGDEFITENNKHYRVTQIEDDYAHCDYLGDIDLKPATQEGLVQPAWQAAPDPSTRPVSNHRNPRVAIYHTHSDESYEPTDGTASIAGKGGILKVGSAFCSTLEKLGLEALHSTTPHDPHDAMAYNRSRRTAAELLRQNPAALFDLHRDAVPRELYASKVHGQDVTKVTLVVGRENPKIKANLNFAQQLKAINDEKNPGLIKGIFLAAGDYNQDLFDRAILLEVGSNENSREAAQRGIALFANSIPQAIGVSASPAPGQPQQATRRTGPWSALGWTLALLIVAGAAYLYLSTGSLNEVKRKLHRFTKAEFSGFGDRKQRDNGDA
jgi:stage II sporulation protein P